jgi:Skp family chaperone for outer membrane proteins
VKLSIVAVALTVALAAPSFAQTPPAGAQPPKPQTPPATAPAQPPAAQPAAPKPQPPVPFPQDSKFGFVDVQQVASGSVTGKAASAKLEDLGKKKQTEIADKSKQLTALQTKQQSAGVLNEAARAALDKDIDKLQREIQFAQQNAQAEYNDLQNELMGDFQKKLIPIIEELAKEKGLYMIFTGESGFAYVHPGLNLSDEVIKRLDAKKN